MAIVDIVNALREEINQEKQARESLAGQLDESEGQINQMKKDLSRKLQK